MALARSIPNPKPCEVGAQPICARRQLGLIFAIKHRTRKPKKSKKMLYLVAILALACIALFAVQAGAKGEHEQKNAMKK